MSRTATVRIVAVVVVAVGAAVAAWFALSGNSSGSGRKQTVAAVFPVTVDAFLQFQDEARKVLEAEAVEVHYFSAEGDPSRFQTVVNAALLRKPDVLVLVGTQLTNTGLGPRYAEDLPPVVSSCISDPSKVDQLVAVGLHPLGRSLSRF